MDNITPQSMAAIGTHERVIELLKEHLRPELNVIDLAAGEGAFSVSLKKLDLM